MSINLKKLLTEQKLIKKIEINHNYVHIVLHDAYDNEEVHHEIIHMFIAMYNNTSAFKNYFKKPRLNGPLLRLTLQNDNNDNYKGNDVLDILIKLTKDNVKDEDTNVKPIKKITQWRFLLKNDLLIESFSIEGSVAKIVLKKDYNDNKNHIPIYLMLKSLLKCAPELNLIFKRPIYPKQKPLGLILTEEGCTKTPHQLLENLKNSVNNTQTKRRQFTLPLANGLLIQSITLQGNQVEIIPDDEYKDDTLTFRKSLAKIYYKSTDFQKKFKPILFGADLKVMLRLKENHGFENAEQVHSALISYAKGAKSNNNHCGTSLQNEPTISMLQDNPNPVDVVTLLQFPSFSELNDFDSQYFLTDDFIYGNNDLIFSGKASNKVSKESVSTVTHYSAPKP